MKKSAASKLPTPTLKSTAPPISAIRRSTMPCNICPSPGKCPLCAAHSRGATSHGLKWEYDHCLEHCCPLRSPEERELCQPKQESVESPKKHEDYLGDPEHLREKAPKAAKQ